MSKKIKKSEALYVLIPGSSYKCDQCSFISTDGCTAYVPKDDKVKPYGGCNLWQPLKDGRIKGNKNYTRAETGYTENINGFSCKRCNYFNRQAYLCEEISEKGPPASSKIDPDGCCDFWEPDFYWATKTNEDFNTVK